MVNTKKKPVLTTKTNKKNTITRNKVHLHLKHKSSSLKSKKNRKNGKNGNNGNNENTSLIVLKNHKKSHKKLIDNFSRWSQSDF